MFNGAMNAIQRAVQLLQTQTALAKACGQHPQAVSRWLRTGRVPSHHCKAIEEATGGRVTCHDLRPDVFAAPAKHAAEASAA